jgi:deoxyhypusine synthase
MLAQARMVMLKIILPVNDIVKKVYIDSIITTEPLEYKDGWGSLKFEYYCENIEIKNNRREELLSEKIKNI